MLTVRANDAIRFGVPAGMVFSVAEWSGADRITRMAASVTSVICTLARRKASPPDVSVELTHTRQPGGTLINSAASVGLMGARSSAL